MNDKLAMLIVAIQFVALFSIIPLGLKWLWYNKPEYFVPATLLWACIMFYISVVVARYWKP